MQTLLFNLPLATAWLFAGVSFLQMMGPSWLQNMYARWETPRIFPYVAAALNLVAAVLLASPTYRMFGIVLGEATSFFLGGRDQRQ
jgi:hypothetical protein